MCSSNRCLLVAWNNNRRCLNLTYLRCSIRRDQNILLLISHRCLLLGSLSLMLLLKLVRLGHISLYRNSSKPVLSYCLSYKLRLKYEVLLNGLILYSWNTNILGLLLLRTRIIKLRINSNYLRILSVLIDMSLLLFLLYKLVLINNKLFLK